MTSSFNGKDEVLEPLKIVVPFTLSRLIIVQRAPTATSSVAKIRT